MSRAFIFPGQGSQYAGMGKALAASYAEAREVFDEVNDALSQDLTAIIWADDNPDLNLTENTQPALMAVSVAVWRVIAKQSGKTLDELAQYAAGHSLGEYSALTVTEALKLADTARLLKLRGQAMQRAVPVGQGAMAAILGLDYDDVQAIADDASKEETCEAANDNSPGQVVISGHKNAVAQAIALATERGAKKAVELPVSAPFHCALMAPAAEEMAQALSDTTISAPIIPVVANVVASEVQDPDQIRELLVKQITGTVRWRESVIWMKDHGITDMAELGAGKVLSGLARRIDRDLSGVSVETPEQIDAFLASLS